MSRFAAYVRNAVLVLREYEGSMPLSNFLKQYFSAHKKFGSTDRKQISNLCFQYFRAGQLLSTLNPEERVLTAHFLCSQKESKIIQALRPDWEVLIPEPISTKFNFLGIEWIPELHTSWFGLIEDDVSADEYALSILNQPLMFLRIRPGKEQSVLQKLEKSNLHPVWQDGKTIALPNATVLPEDLKLNAEVVVQDAGSQRVGFLLSKWLPSVKGKVWDACAASGGKSIQLFDLYKGNIDLTLSDIRKSILHNLHSRLKEAGIQNYNSLQIDLESPLMIHKIRDTFDLIVADVPCTGSGTWARTPEQHYFFKEDTLTSYTQKQLTIGVNLEKFLKSGGYFLYITCSVFENENRGLVQKLCTETGLILKESEVINGIAEQADSMYVALLQKN